MIDYCTRFADHFGELTGNQYVIPTCNGTAATTATLTALGITDGYVSVPAFTFISVANSVLAVGARPSFVDIRADTLCMDTTKPLQEHVICVHTFGKTCQLPQGHTVIEDCCQNLFANQGGTARIYSFYGVDRGKQLRLGEGGAVGTNNKALADKIAQVCNHGRKDRFTFTEFGLNYRMSQLLAKIGLQKLEAGDYDKTYKGGGTEAGFYPYVIYQQPIYKRLGIHGDCPVAEKVAEKVRNHTLEMSTNV